MWWLRGWARRCITGEDGIILPLLLVLLALGLLICAPTLGHGFTSLQGHRMTESRAEEMYAADSGVEEGLYWLTRGQPGTEYVWNEVEGEWTRSNFYEMNGMHVNVTIVPLTGEGMEDRRAEIW